jgi:probable HAF family extracellular repeat protein
MRLKRSSAKWIPVAIGIAAGLALLLRPRPQKLYKVTILPSLGGQATAPHGVNDHGQVAGIAQVASGAYHLFLWGRAESMQDLGLVEEDAVDINESGQVVGTKLDPNGCRRAFLWDAEAGVTFLPTLGGPESRAAALNDRGQVIGVANAADLSSRAFIWDAVHGIRDLSVRGERQSWARAVNNAGQVIGLSEAPGSSITSFLWDPNGGHLTRRLPSPLGTCHDIDATGAVLTHAQYPGKGRYMVFWRRDTGDERLFPLESRPVYLACCNAAGQIVFGQASPPARGPIARLRARFWSRRFHAYLWDPNRGRISLDEQMPCGRSEFFAALDLSDNGCIVGVIVSNNLKRGRGVVLEPIPERWEE